MKLEEEDYFQATSTNISDLIYKRFDRDKDGILSGEVARRQVSGSEVRQMLEFTLGEEFIEPSRTRGLDANKDTFLGVLGV